MPDRKMPTDGTPIYEGPANLYYGPGIRGDQYTERMANDGERFFTNAYGERGVGWDFDPSTHEGENNFIRFGNETDRMLGREALRNRERTGKMMTDAGEPVTQRQLEAMMKGDQADRGSLIIYPNGDMHAARRGLKT